MKLDDIQKIYVLNLVRRDDRWQSIQDEWNKTGVKIPLTRFIGIDGQKVTPPKSWDVGKGAYGCYLSHISALTDMIRFDLDNVIVFEDDACFCDDFKNKFEACLADLPAVYDQFYLGWQALHTDRVPPARINDHIGRAGNNNRTHATMYSNRGARRLLAHLQDLSERKRKDHIDHWLGRLHEQLDAYGEHTFDVYNAIPQLVYQAPGQSDICGKATPLNTWVYNGPWVKEEPKIYHVIKYQTGYGDMGKNGQLGYERLKVELPDKAYLTTLSLHAPSKVVVVLSEGLYCCGYMNPSGGPGEPVDAIVDGVVIGQIKGPGSMTEPIKLAPGEHVLEFKIKEEYKGMAHSVWVFSRV